MESKLAKQVRYLQIYVAILTACLLLLTASAFAPRQHHERLEEIDVERINIVEKDGRLRMVIANQERQHPGIVNGQPIHRDSPRPPGLIFFNHLGDEMGGLVFGENGGKGHFGSLTFDKVGGDQTVGFRYLESDNGQALSGLEMWQQPGYERRLFLGKQRDDALVLVMSDVRGKPRISLQVQSDGTPRLDFLSGEGQVLYSLPTPPGAATRR